jgi:hypothetical protein
MDGQMHHHVEESWREDLLKFAKNDWDFLFKSIQNVYLQCFAVQLSEEISKLNNRFIYIFMDWSSEASR